MTLGLRAYDWHKLYALPRAEGLKTSRECDAYFQREVFQYIRQQPMAFLGGLYDKMIQLISSRELPRSEDPYFFRSFSTVLGVLFWKIGGWGFPFGPLLPLGLLGRWWSRRQAPGVMAAMVLASGALLILVHIAGRFRLPMVPYLALYASVAIRELVRMVGRRRFVRLSVICGLLGLWGLLSSRPGPFVLEKVRYDVEYTHFLGTAAMNQVKRLMSTATKKEGPVREQIQPLIETALQAFERAIQLDDHFYPAFSSRGQLYLETLGQPDKAEADLDRAIALEPQMASSWANRAILRFNKRQFSEALADADRATALEPDDPRGFNTRGLILTDGFGQHERALADLQTALKLDPAFADAYINRGKVFVQTGNPDKAIQDFSHAISVRPTSFIAYGNRGNAWFLKGDAEKAIQDYDRALTINPEYATAKENRAKVLGAMKRD